MSTETISAPAQALYQQSFVMDNALGFEPELEVPYKWDVLASYKKAGFNYVTLSMATDATTLEKTMQYLAAHIAKFKQFSNQYIMVDKVDDILHAKQENKLAIGFMFQGTNPLSKDLNMLELYYKLGIRSMIVAYNVRNAFGDGVAELNDAGLSVLGKKLVERMNDVGMLIDLSHSSYQTSLDAMMLSKQPVIFSHSSVYGLQPHPRNLKDEQIKALAKNGGVIGINSINIWLGEKQSTPERYVEHIDYISQLVGAQHVMLGTDNIYFPELINDFLDSNALMYPPQYTEVVKSAGGLNSLHPAQIIKVVDLLLKRGYSTDAIKGILGENYLRVVRQVWK